jgi:hypothetical protein
MRYCKTRIWISAGLYLALLATWPNVALGQDAKAAAFDADITKSGRVERSAKKVAADLSSSVKDVANPKVKPGLVNWHVSFEKARQAAQKSGKPILLFHMMGKLDDQFC